MGGIAKQCICKISGGIVYDEWIAGKECFPVNEIGGKNSYSARLGPSEYGKHWMIRMEQYPGGNQVALILENVDHLFSEMCHRAGGQQDAIYFLEVRADFFGPLVKVEDHIK
jgi:hypothetical protein